MNLTHHSPPAKQDSRYKRQETGIPIGLLGGIFVAVIFHFSKIQGMIFGARASAFWNVSDNPKRLIIRALYVSAPL
jgi:hypothetical protein